MNAVDTLVSQAEYARHRGVTRQAISKLVKAGRIQVDAQGRVDMAAADFTLDGNRARVNTPTAGESAADSPPPPRGGVPGVAGATDGLTKARTVTEVYNARIKELEYEQKIGKLLRVEDVTRSMEQCAEVMTRELDQLHLLAEEVVTTAATGGAVAVRALLKDKARAMRNAMAKAMRVLAANEPPAERAS